MDIINGIKIHKNYSGKIYNDVKILRPVKTNSKDIKWICKCSCGNEFLARASSVATGNTKSCGCLKFTANKTHGFSKKRFYKIWQSMHQRVKGNIKKSKQYTKLKIQPDWIDFECFHRDMYKSYRRFDGELKKLSLERINNDEGYNKSNCTWANATTQSRNRSISSYRSSKDQMDLF